jgi:hypothetical protein
MSKYTIDDALIQAASIEELEKWANDPECRNPEECRNRLAAQRLKREQEERTARAVAERRAAEAQKRLSERRQQLLDSPFDPRNEVSADAKSLNNNISEDAKYIAGRIVKHLWIIFVLLPFVLALLLVIAGVIK